MNSKKVSQNVRWAAKQTVNIVFVLSISLLMLLGYIFTGMVEQVNVAYMFISGLFGVVLASGITVGSLRLSLSGNYNTPRYIALIVAALAIMSMIIFVEACGIAGDLLHASGIDILYLGNGYNIITYDAYLVIGDVTSALIIGSLGMFLVYHATVLWDYVEEYRKKVNDG